MHVSSRKARRFLFSSAHLRDYGMPRLTIEQRAEAIGMLRARVSIGRVANNFGVSRPTIYNLLTKHQATGSVKDRPRAGRPRVTTGREDRHIRTANLRSEIVNR